MNEIIPSGGDFPVFPAESTIDANIVNIDTNANPNQVDINLNVVVTQPKVPDDPDTKKTEPDGLDGGEEPAQPEVDEGNKSEDLCC